MELDTLLVTDLLDFSMLGSEAQTVKNLFLETGAILALSTTISCKKLDLLAKELIQ